MLDGSRVQRRFLKTETLDLVFTFVDSQLPLQIEEYPPYNLVSNFPRKTFTDANRSETLQEAALTPQASLFVAERS